MDARLSSRQKRFAEQYASGNSGTKAYQAAYGTDNPDVAASNAWRLLRNEKVREVIDALSAKAAEEAEVTAERVLRELSVLAFMPVELAAGVPGLATQKTRALDLLARHLGLLVDRTEISMAGGDLATRMGEAMARVARICAPDVQAEAAPNL